MKLTLSAPAFGGSVRAVSSKSCAHRLFICAALSSNPCSILCPDRSEDIDATLRCLRALGCEIQETGFSYKIAPLQQDRRDPVVLDCGESGSTLRFLLPVVGALGLNATFLLRGRLSERPLEPLLSVLSEHGMRISEPGHAALHVSGKLHSAAFSLPGNISSQFLSGLLFALPLVGGSLCITESLESSSYVDLTLQALRTAALTVSHDAQTLRVSGCYRMPDKAAVEGDWSNAAFWLCAGAIGSKPVTVTGLQCSSVQGDRQIVSLLRRFGAEVQEREDSVCVYPSVLHGITLDAAQIPDLVPPLALLASCAEGETRITGASRLRKKESDRLQSITSVLQALGGTVRECEDGLVFYGHELHSGCVNAHGDHRIAMLAAIAALRAGTVTLENAESVSKSYPNFYKDYAALGGVVEESPYGN